MVLWAPSTKKHAPAATTPPSLTTKLHPPDLAPVHREYWPAVLDGAGGKAALQHYLRTTPLGALRPSAQSSFMRKANSWLAYEGPVT